MDDTREQEIRALLRPGKGLRCFKPEQREQRQLLEAGRDLLAEVERLRQPRHLSEDAEWIAAVLELLIHPLPRPGALDEYVSVPTLVRKAKDKLAAMAAALATAEAENARRDERDEWLRIQMRNCVEAAHELANRTGLVASRALVSDLRDAGKALASRPGKGAAL